MYLLSGLAGAMTIVLSLFLVFELAGTPLVGGPESGAPSRVRIVFLGVLTVASAIASMRFHHRSHLDPACRGFPRLKRVEGVLFTFVGGILLCASGLWLYLSGGAYGLHLIGFLLGGGLIVSGLQKLRGLG